jgi:inner membrane protein
MDSLSQAALGAAVGLAAMGRRTAPWKAALWGAVCGTLPDLDVLIDHGDAVRNMTLHRAESHALFWLTLASPLLAGGIAALHRETAGWRRWWLAVWLALVTHPLLDAMTVYGTQLALPFSDRPYGVGSIFIIDPLYTLPLLAGVGAALRLRGARGARWNAAGLVLATAYLAWSVAAQQLATSAARAALSAQGIAPERLLVTPTPFNTLLWRVVAVTPDSYHEGFHSLLDTSPGIAFERHPRGAELAGELRGLTPVERLAWFSRGFYRYRESAGELHVSDLRMGQEPHYLFTFTVARREAGRVVAVPPVQVGLRPDLRRSLVWLWRRASGEPIPPLR